MTLERLERVSNSTATKAVRFSTGSNVAVQVLNQSATAKIQMLEVTNIVFDGYD